MIIGRDLMVQLGLSANFKRQVLQWDGTTLPMKEPSDLLGKSDLNKREIRKVVIHTAEPDSTREATERLVKKSTVPMQWRTLNMQPIKQPI